MGIVKTAFTFMAGTLFGVYITQAYDLPNIPKLAESSLTTARRVEETYRKPSNNKDSGDSLE